MKLEPHNFRIPSKGWKTSKLSRELLESPSGDVWQIADGHEAGEQLFNWNAALREAAKAGKRIPTDEEWSELAKTKADIPNLVFAGYRSLAGGFHGRGTDAGVWSSSQDSATGAWSRTLGFGYATVYRSTGSRASGFSLRCLQDSSGSSDSSEKMNEWESLIYILKSRCFEFMAHEISSKKLRATQDNLIKEIQKQITLAHNSAIEEATKRIKKEMRKAQKKKCENCKFR